MNTEIFVGVDISKEHLDVAFGPDQAPQRFPYTPEGVNRLLAHLQALSPTSSSWRPPVGWKPI